MLPLIFCIQISSNTRPFRHFQTFLSLVFCNPSFSPTIPLWSSCVCSHIHYFTSHLHFFFVFYIGVFHTPLCCTLCLVGCFNSSSVVVEAFSSCSCSLVSFFMYLEFIMQEAITPKYSANSLC